VRKPAAAKLWLRDFASAGERGYHGIVRALAAVLTALLLLIAIGSPGHAQVQTHPRVLRILFIGNSYTHFHQLRHVVRRVIQSAEPDVVVHTQEVTHSGWDLWRHWRAGIARRRLGRAGFYTHVVLQGHSLAPLRDRERERMTHAAHQFSQLIEHAGAQAILYETWARRSGHRVYRQGEAAGPDDMQARIDRTYEAIASDTGASIAPVGDTFRRIATVLPERELYSHDGSHPSELGTFVAAATLATRIAGIAPNAITYRPIEITREQFDTVRRAVAQGNE